MFKLVVITYLSIAPGVSEDIAKMQFSWDFDSWETCRDFGMETLSYTSAEGVEMRFDCEAIPGSGV